MRLKQYIKESKQEYKKDDLIFIKETDKSKGMLWDRKGSIMKVLRAYKNGMLTLSGSFRGGTTQGRSGKLASGKGYSGEESSVLVKKMKINPKDFKIEYIGNSWDEGIMDKLRPYQRK